MLVQITTPHGPVYVNPQHVSLIGSVRTELLYPAADVRFVATLGQGCFDMLDTPENMDKLLSAKDAAV